MAQQLLLVFVVCAVACAVGFHDFVWFMSIGYGFAIAAGAVTLAVLYCGAIPAVVAVQLTLFVLYGARLSGFLLWREAKNAAYRKTLEQASRDTAGDKPMPVGVKVAIWLSVAALYAIQLSPAHYRLLNGATDVVVPAVGAAVSALGLALETAADLQKSAQKAKRPDMVATQGLYRLVRCPNYLGELVFWTGAFVGGLSTYHGAQWALPLLAWVAIIGIMVSGAQRLEKRQFGRYASNPEYRAYAAHTPILVPLVPLYHLYKDAAEADRKA